MENQKENINNKILKLKNKEDIEKLDTIKKIDDYIVNILLFQKENQEILGIPGKIHSEQNEKVLKESQYWDISNILQILELKKKIINENLNSFHSFTGGGSIGVGYLGSILKDYETNKFPDVIFGYSAGSLFTAIFLLYKKACEINPEKMKIGLNSILKILPQYLDGKTMFLNGEELINDFKNTSQNLINIINEKLPNSEKLENINNITIDDLSKNFKIISSRKSKGSVQEVIFGGKDKLLPSIIASSNPELNILGININILTSKDNKFYSNEWIDGYHSNPNLILYANILGIKNKKENVTLSKYSDLFKKNGGEIHDTFFIPDYKSFLQGTSINKYKEIEQNGNWGIEEMKLKIIMSYYKYLSFSNIGFFLENIENNIKDQNIIGDIYNFLENGEYLTYNIGNPNKIKESIEKIRNLKYVNEKQREKIIGNIFYHKYEVNTELRFKSILGILPKYYDIDGIIPNKTDKILSDDEKLIEFISYINWNKDDEDYEKLILKLTTKEKLEKLIFDNIENNEYNLIFKQLFLNTSILESVSKDKILLFLENHLKLIKLTMQKFDTQSYIEYLMNSLLKKLNNLGKNSDFLYIIKELEKKGIDLKNYN